MKQLLFVFAILTFVGEMKSQKSSVGIKKIEYKLIEWDLKTKFPYTISNFSSHYSYRFTVKEPDLYEKMLDFESAENYLISQNKLLFDSSAIEKKSVTSLIFLEFYGGKTIKLYFDYYGNYWYRKIWYKKREDLYGYLFKYFSSVIAR